MMRDLWNSYSVPIAATGVGLLLVILLGLAPLFGRNSPPPAAAAPAPTAATEATVPASTANAVDADAVQAALTRQSQALDSLTNRVTTLEKGITRMNQRLVATTDQLGSISGLPADVARTEGQIAILNKAVPRIHARVSAQADGAASLPEMERQLATLQAEMRILNAAVPRLQARIKALQAQ